MVGSQHTVCLVQTSLDKLRGSRLDPMLLDEIGRCHVLPQRPSHQAKVACEKRSRYHFERLLFYAVKSYAPAFGLRSTAQMTESLTSSMATMTPSRRSR